MKKLLSLGCLILGIIFFSSTTAFAQPDIKVGGGLAWGSEIESIGIQGGAVLGFSDKIRGAADVTIFFPDDPPGGDNSFWELNANLHYMLLSKASTSVYGLAGLNYATQEVSGGGFSASNSEVGLNLGGGAEFGVGFGSIYVEAKYAVSNFDQLGLAGGIRFGL